MPEQSDIDYVAQEEGVDASKLANLVRAGRAVVVRNLRRSIKPLGIGEGLRTKVNANVGLSPRASTPEKEVKKALVALKHGADTIMDLSTGPYLKKTLSAILRHIDAPIGTVPVYQAFGERGFDMTSDSIFRVIEDQCKKGVDFITVHCGIKREYAKKLRGCDRLIPITSKGGAALAAWMLRTGEENPLYADYDHLLDIAREYNVVLSLGDALRPAALHDAGDFFQMAELKTLGELTKRSRERGVQVIVEGPGHMPLDMIEKHVREQKKICGGAPYYVLGPLVTDTALGYDHISGAIGGAIAAASGVDFLCYVTPSEHYSLPGEDDVKRGVIASKIAAHAGDIVKLGKRGEDDTISEARSHLDWHTMARYAMDEATKQRVLEIADSEPCTMCGDLCAMKISQSFVVSKKKR